MTAPRRKPERYGPVTTLDLERLRETVLSAFRGAADLDPVVHELDTLILRSKIAAAAANAKRERRRKGGDVNISGDEALGIRFPGERP